MTKKLELDILYHLATNKHRISLNGKKPTFESYGAHSQSCQYLSFLG